ncbi:MAG TPA: response regulator [Candidatus Binataceae bacterium]|nr:response regulator [Candidatus Binataceae bacterium]
MSRSPTRRDDQQKASILIIEDEPVLAFVLEEFLIESGFTIAGVAGRLETALAMIESAVFDVAILDANLAGVDASPAASALRARERPFIVVSGYLPSQQPRAFAGALCLQKPCRPERLVQALHNILSAQ